MHNNNKNAYNTTTAFTPAGLLRQVEKIVLSPPTLDAHWLWHEAVDHGLLNPLHAYFDLRCA